MNIKRMANNIYEMFQQKQDTSGTFLESFRFPCNSKSKVNLNDRVSSKWTEENERNMPVTEPIIFLAGKEKSNEANHFWNFQTDDKPNKNVQLSGNFAFTAENSRISRRSKTSNNEAKPKRPGLLRSGPLTQQRQPKPPFKLHYKEDTWEKSNLPSRAFLLSCSSQSSEYYDDRSPVFGGCWSDSSSMSSMNRLCLNKLGSSDSDRSYGGEEGAKPAFSINSNRSIFRGDSLSEGPAELDAKRPQWTPTRDQELSFFFTPSTSGHSSSSMDSHLRMSPSSKENSTRILPTRKEDREDT